MRHLEDDPPPIARKVVAEATKILKDYQRKKVEPYFAYAALGNAFARMHRALGRTKEDWLETSRVMADELFSDD